MMSFFDSIVTCYKKSFTISGRASRAEYWWFMLYFHLLCFIVVGLVNLKINILAIPIGIVIIFSLIPAFTAQVRRLHDREHSGRNILWGAIPYLGFIGAIYLVIVECSSSDLGENDYGPNPYNDGFNEVEQDSVLDFNEVNVDPQIVSSNELENNQSIMHSAETDLDGENKKSEQIYVNKKEKLPEGKSSEWEEI